MSLFATADARTHIGDIVQEAVLYTAVYFLLYFTPHARFPRKELCDMIILRASSCCNIVANPIRPSAMYCVTYVVHSPCASGHFSVLLVVGWHSTEGCLLYIVVGFRSLVGLERLVDQDALCVDWHAPQDVPRPPGAFHQPASRTRVCFSCHSII